MSKRRADDHDQDTRASKHAKADPALRLAETFPPELQVPFSEILEVLRTPSTTAINQYIAGKVVMKWKPTGRGFRFVLGDGENQCEVMLVGERYNHLEETLQCSFVKIGLKGASINSNTKSTTQKKLVYEHDAIFGWKDAKSQVGFIDGFEERTLERSEKEADWFATPLVAVVEANNKDDLAHRHESSIPGPLPLSAEDPIPLITTSDPVSRAPESKEKKRRQSNSREKQNLNQTVDPGDGLIKSASHSRSRSSGDGAHPASIKSSSAPRPTTSNASVPKSRQSTGKALDSNDTSIGRSEAQGGIAQPDSGTKHPKDGKQSRPRLKKTKRPSESPADHQESRRLSQHGDPKSSKTKPAKHPQSPEQGSVARKGSATSKNERSAQNGVSTNSMQPPAQVPSTSKATNGSSQVDKPLIAKHAKKRERDQTSRQKAFEFVPGFECPARGRYFPLNELVSKKKASFVGIATAVTERVEIFTGDVKVTVSLVDPTVIATNGIFKVNCFAKKGQDQWLPDVRPSQPILLRNIHIKDHLGKENGVGYKGEYSWVAFDPSTGQATHNNATATTRAQQELLLKPTAAELEYFVKINEWYRSIGARQLGEAAASQRNPQEVDDFAGCEKSTVDMMDYVPKGVVIAKPKPPPEPSYSQTSKPKWKKRGLVLLESINVNEFIDCEVEILEFFHPRYDSNASEMYVTDYTKNNMFPSHRVGPEGRTLKIRLWDSQKETAMHLKPGFYKLKNVCIKIDGLGALEGNLRGGHIDGFQKLAAGVKEVQMLKARRELLERGEDPSHPDQIQAPVTEIHVPSTPKEKPELITNEQDPVSPQFDIRRQEAISALVEHEYLNEKVNTLNEVLCADLIPFRCRVRARVIDFYPKEFEQWVVGRCTKCSTVFERGQQLCFHCADMEVPSKLFYRFALKLQDDEGTELVLLVNGEEAEMFLSNIAPAFLNDMKGFRNFGAYVNPILSSNGKPGPPLDLCIAGTTSDSGTRYTLFGCRLLS